MLRKHTFMFPIVFIILAVIGFYFGYSIGVEKSGTNSLDDIAHEIKHENIHEDNKQIDRDIENNEIIHDKTEDIQIMKDDIVISPNTEIEYKTIYTECGHVIIEIKAPSEEMINMKEEQFKAYICNNHPNWDVISFGKDKITIQIIKNQLCQRHYIIGVKDGYITIFKINEKGEKVPYKSYKDQPVNMLKKVDQEKLYKGIIVDEDNIGDVLQNFIS